MSELINVDIEWIEEDRAYMATSKDVKGFAIEARSIDVLMERTKLILWDLLETGTFSILYTHQEAVNFFE